MDWASWVGDAIAAVAVVVSVAARRRSRIANAAAREAERRADSMDKSMQAMAAALQSIAEQSLAHEGAAVVPPAIPVFKLEAAGGAEYRLRNVSSAAATGVEFTVPDGYQVAGYTDTIRVNLHAFESVSFMMALDAMDDQPRLGELSVMCDQFQRPVFVAVP